MSGPMKPVGVLGGMGPEATILLMQKVLDRVDARDDADHVPLIVHQNPQVPSRIAALIDGTGEDPGPVLAGMARGLAAAGARALAMPCNTAHAYADQVREATDLPFLDMVAATAREIPEDAVVGLLADPTRMLALIRAIKARGGSPEAAAELRALADEVGQVDLLIVACTELSLVTGGLAPGTWLDALDVLAADIVAFARG
jgi:aspartate racemase